MSHFAGSQESAYSFMLRGKSGFCANKMTSYCSNTNVINNVLNVVHNVIYNVVCNEWLKICEIPRYFE